MLQKVKELQFDKNQEPIKVLKANRKPTRRGYVVFSKLRECLFVLDEKFIIKGTNQNRGYIAATFVAEGLFERLVKCPTFSLMLKENCFVIQEMDIEEATKDALFYKTKQGVEQVYKTLEEEIPDQTEEYRKMSVPKGYYRDPRDKNNEDDGVLKIEMGGMDVSHAIEKGW